MSIVVSALTIIGCSTVPLLYNCNAKCHIENLNEIIDLLKDTLQEVSHLYVTIPDALRSSKFSRNEVVRKTVDDFLDSLLDNNNNFEQEWQKAISDNKEKLKLTDEEYSIVLKLGTYMNSSKSHDITSVISSFELIIQKLENITKQQQEKYDKYAPMYNKLGLLCGIAASIFTI